MLRGDASRRESLDGRPQGPGVILDQCVGEAGFVTLLAADQAQIRCLSLASSSSMPASCSITSGPFNSSRACGKTTR